MDAAPRPIQHCGTTNYWALHASAQRASSATLYSSQLSGTRGCIGGFCIIGQDAAFVGAGCSPWTRTTDTPITNASVRASTSGAGAWLSEQHILWRKAATIVFTSRENFRDNHFTNPAS